MISVRGMALVSLVGYKLSGARFIKMWIISIDVRCLMISVLGMALIGYKLSGARSIKMWIMSIDVTCLYRWQIPMSQSQSDMCHFDSECDDRIKRTNWVCTASNLLPIVLVLVCFSPSTVSAWNIQDEVLIIFNGSLMFTGLYLPTTANGFIRLRQQICQRWNIFINQQAIHVKYNFHAQILSCLFKTRKLYCLYTA